MVSATSSGWISLPIGISGTTTFRTLHSTAAQAARKAVAPKLYFEFPIGFDEALDYKKAHGQHLRRNQWQDLTVHVYI